jgi:hypothetical protein
LTEAESFARSGLRACGPIQSSPQHHKSLLYRLFCRFQNYVQSTEDRNKSRLEEP